MFRRILHLIAVLALVLGGSAAAMRLGPKAAPVVCACGCGCPESLGPTCPCGMPKSPSTPTTPDLNPGNLGVAQVTVARQQAEAQPEPRREARPCPSSALASAPEAVGFQAALGHGTARFAPPWRVPDRLAELSLLRV